MPLHQVIKCSRGSRFEGFHKSCVGIGEGPEVRNAIQFYWWAWRVGFFECLLQHNFSPQQMGCATCIPNRALKRRSGYLHPSELAAALILQGVRMRLGPLNALLTALESNESVQTPGHFPQIPKRPDDR